MNQDNFGNFIKEIRKKNNLTQKQLAERYNVTYQAVSKWENGKNMPDTILLKQMSEDFNISLEDIIDGNLNNKRKSKKHLYLILFIFILILTITIYLIINNINNDDFSFKTLSSSCNNFDVSGNIAYNDKKSSIYLTNIKYCGKDTNEKYKKIECILYESNDNIEKKIEAFNYNENKEITLDTFLKQITFTVDDYKKTCKEYSKNSLYLAINATDKNDKTTTYKIPLKLENSCSK